MAIDKIDIVLVIAFMFFTCFIVYITYLKQGKMEMHILGLLKLIIDAKKWLKKENEAKNPLFHQRIFYSLTFSYFCFNYKLNNNVIKIKYTTCNSFNF